MTGPEAPYPRKAYTTSSALLQPLAQKHPQQINTHTEDHRGVFCIMLQEVLTRSCQMNPNESACFLNVERHPVNALQIVAVHLLGHRKNTGQETDRRRAQTVGKRSFAPLSWIQRLGWKLVRGVHTARSQHL